MLILIDAMGGDHAPEAVVHGCIDALKEMDGYELALIGDSNKIKKILSDQNFDSPRLSIVHTDEVITNDDSPTKAIKSKKNSSMVTGFSMLKEKKGEVFLSAGSTGALMAGGLFILGRIKGIDRPALAPVLPTKKTGVLLIDGGANTVCKPVNYLQFGIMGSIYMKEVFSIDNPRVGLINNGTEEKKGTEIVRQSLSLLSNAKINFLGNIEGRDIPEGNVDVAVCDGFIGNILLKFVEGVGSFVKESVKGVFLKNTLSKFAALIVKDELKNFSKKLDYSEYGGVPLLGINGKVMKAHGSSNSKAIKNAIFKAYSYGKSTVLEQISEQFSNMEVDIVEESD